MDLANIPIELPEKPADVDWINHFKVKNEIEGKLTAEQKVLICTLNNNRLLISSSRSRGTVSEHEYFSGEMLKFDPKSQKIVQGISVDHFFNVANRECEKCKKSYVIITRNNRRLVACTDCWIKFMSNQPQTGQIRWIQFDCENYYLNTKKIWQYMPNNTNLTQTGRDIQINHYVQSEPTLHACTKKCGVVAKGTITGYRKFPCHCRKASIVVSCCDKWHPPIPCRLLDRWTRLRGQVCQTDTGHPSKSSDGPRSWILEEYGRDGPEIDWTGDRSNYNETFVQFFRKYNETHKASVVDEETADEHLKSNAEIRNERIFLVNGVTLKSAISTLTKCQHFLMYFYIYQFYLTDPANSGVIDAEFKDFELRVLLLANDLRRKLSVDISNDDLTSWSDRITNATRRLQEDRENFLRQIMENGNFDFNV